MLTEKPAAQSREVPRLALGEGPFMGSAKGPFPEGAPARCSSAPHVLGDVGRGEPEVVVRNSDCRKVTRTCSVEMFGQWVRYHRDYVLAPMFRHG